MDTIRLTAFDVAAMDLDSKFRLVGGRVWYDFIRLSYTHCSVKLAYLRPFGLGDSFTVVERYIKPHWLLEVELNDAVKQQLAHNGVTYRKEEAA